MQRRATAALSALTLAAALGSASASFASRPGPAPPRTGADDVVTVPFPAPPYTPLNATTWHGKVPSTGRTYTAYSGVVGSAARFSFELPKDGCSTRHNVSVSAVAFGCELATNGGFFSFSGHCEGNLVVNGSTVLWSGDNTVNLGLTAANTTIVGFISNATYESYGFTSLLSGRGWLVRDGASYVAQSPDLQPNGTFVTEKAPRSAVGVDARGRLQLVVVDGIEVTKQGLDLFEFAEVLVDLGLQQAINMDGGGSSDAVLKGQVWSKPTCDDEPPKPYCERPVTSIACIRY